MDPETDSKIDLERILLLFKHKNLLGGFSVFRKLLADEEETSLCTSNDSILIHK